MLRPILILPPPPDESNNNRTEHTYHQASICSATAPRYVGTTTSFSQRRMRIPKAAPLFFLCPIVFCCFLRGARCLPLSGSLCFCPPLSPPVSLSLCVSLSFSPPGSLVRKCPLPGFSGRALHPRLLDKAARCLAALSRHSNGMVNELMNHVQKQVFFLGAGGGGGGGGGRSLFRGGRSRNGLHAAGHGGLNLPLEGLWIEA